MPGLRRFYAGSTRGLGRILGGGVFVVMLTSCKFPEQKQQFGGTSTFTPISDVDSGSGIAADEAAANFVLDSSSTVFKFDSAANLTATTPQNLPNQSTLWGISELTAGSASLLSWSGLWLQIAPDVTGAGFSSPLEVDISTTSSSVIAVFDSNSIGVLVSLNPNDRDNQNFEIANDGTKTYARFISSPGDKIETSIEKPTGPEVILAASFADDDSTIDLYLNGVKASTPLATGTPLSPFSIPRVFNVGPINPGEQLALKSLYLINRKLTAAEMGALIRSVARKHNIAGLVLDPSLGSAPSGGGGSTDKFPQVRSVIQTSCSSCHSSWGSASSSFFVSSGLVVKGNPEASPLYYRLSGTTGGAGPKNMPQSAPALNSASQDLIKDWIQTLP